MNFKENIKKSWNDFVSELKDNWNGTNNSKPVVIDKDGNPKFNPKRISLSKIVLFSVVSFFIGCVFLSVCFILTYPGILIQLALTAGVAGGLIVASFMFLMSVVIDAVYYFRQLFDYKKCKVSVTDRL